ncbi:Hypothetical predicted protein [Cloeon dipterum]|uniref:CAP-Gly domain-containing protein n=1 Tax=Cloeon dipterum TaxID=197152 RepID=A0A8S1CL42_9INSE|nr:Hypothetical predicted protein [Cloeon dipterum]
MEPMDVAEGSVSVINADFVKVFVSVSTSSTYSAEKSFARGITVADLKCKLELMTGASAGSMQLTVLDKAGNRVCLLDDNNRLLGSYPVDNGMVIFVADVAPKFDFDLNSSEVQKFELSAEKYAERGDTVRAHLARNKIGKFDPAREEQLRQEREALALLEAELASKIGVGNRCQVAVPEQPTRRGQVMFVGTVHFKPGVWVGVKLDEPCGKNDGSVEGQRYFTCPPKYGSFVKVSYVTVGNFPEIDPFEVDEI